jgi:hypothetical protein
MRDGQAGFPCRRMRRRRVKRRCRTGPHRVSTSGTVSRHRLPPNFLGSFSYLSQTNYIVRAFFIFDRLPEVGRRPRRVARVVKGLPTGLRIARNGTGRFASIGAWVRGARKPFALRRAAQPAAIGRPKPPRRRVATPGRVLHHISFFGVAPARGGFVRDGRRPC